MSHTVSILYVFVNTVTLLHFGNFIAVICVIFLYYLSLMFHIQDLFFLPGTSKNLVFYCSCRYLVIPFFHMKITHAKYIFCEFLRSFLMFIFFFGGAVYCSIQNIHIFMRSLVSAFFAQSVAEFLVPDWGDKVYSGIGLSHRPGRLHRLAGRYDTMP